MPPAHLVTEHDDVEVRLETERAELVALDRGVAVGHETDVDLGAETFERVDDAGIGREARRSVGAEASQQWRDGDVVVPDARERLLEEGVVEIEEDGAQHGDRYPVTDAGRERERSASSTRSSLTQRRARCSGAPS